MECRKCSWLNRTKEEGWEHDICTNPMKRRIDINQENFEYEKCKYFEDAGIEDDLDFWDDCNKEWEDEE